MFIHGVIEYENIARQEKFLKENYPVVDFKTCNHRQEMEVFGIKKRGLFCDIDNMECDESSGVCRNYHKK